MNYEILQNYALQELLSDFTLILPEEMNKERIPAHKIILAANSPFF